MLRMLVVDDDKFEREGVKFLVHKHGLQLDIIEADSGESAYRYLEQHEVDILLTDIRMREMDGLMLAEKARRLRREMKVIFMSAYGEFEYAQRAIDLKAICYILKPVEVSEFVKVVSEVIQIREEERISKQQLERMEESYRKELNYNKQKLLSDLIVGKTEVEETARELPMPISGFIGFRYVRMLLIDSRSRCFDRFELDLEIQMTEALQRGFDFVHLNEFQSLLFIEAFENDTADRLTALCQRLKGWFRDNFDCDVTIVIGSMVEDAKELYKEYSTLETVLENKFFFNEGAVLLANRTSFEAEDLSKAVNELMTELTGNIKQNRYDMARVCFDQLFDTLQNSNHFSVVYVKYCCTEIVKTLKELSHHKDDRKFKTFIEKIYKTTQLNDLRQVVLFIIDEYEPQTTTAGEGVSKAIEEVVQMIEHEYASDLSLDWLAERVYLSPNYLSHLFKKQKKISVNKYITLYRMNKAKELLLTTNRKIVDIGKEVGYHNFPYFGSLFKNHFGKTPSQFREEA